MFAITPGEPAGIGPDLIVRFAQRDRNTAFVVVGSAELLRARAEQLNLALEIDDHLESPSGRAGQITVLDQPIGGSTQAGVLDVANVEGVLRSLDTAIRACRQGRFHGLITGPMQKSIVNEAGVVFTGHTEYLAAQTDTKDVVMLLVAGDFRVALATTHIPLASVAASITEELLVRRIGILATGLQDVFGIAEPRIYVAGLNPHAGESGHLGREEIEHIEPAIEGLRKQGHDVHGPLPADTLFTPQYVAQADGFMAMYHDQGLPVLKYAGFGQAVNVTLGLPFIRVSVDHGTALDRAGTEQVDEGSFSAACVLAVAMQHARSSTTAAD